MRKTEHRGAAMSRPKFIWRKWKKDLHPETSHSLGHGLCVYDQKRKRGNLLIGFVEGYAWYHGMSDGVVIYTIDPDAATTANILEQLKELLEEGLTKHWGVGPSQEIELVVKSFP